MYRWIDHTAELELEIEAPSEPEVLADAMSALAELHAPDLRPPAAPDMVQRVLIVRAHDRPALLAGWLEELVFLAESEGFVATQLTQAELREDELVATVAGFLDEPPPLVKAVTYHRLVFEHQGDGYIARVVLDV